MRYRAFAATAAVCLSGCATPQPPLDPHSVRIERTEFHVAHITAADDESLAYGTAYAHAQDSACTTEDAMLTARGERSRYLPAEAQGILGLRSMPNLTIDLFIRSHMDDAALSAAYDQVSDDTKASMRGYVAGFNRYLHDVGQANVPGDCHGAPWVKELTIGDLRRLTEVTMIQAGLALLADGVVAAQPPTTAVSSSPVSVDADPTTLPALARSIGSNGWAFGSDVTSARTGLLLGNPHFPWVGPNRFWQVHLTIPGQLDVMGASIGESSVVQIGFNHDVAWTHTVSTGKRFTIYELNLVPGDATSYLVDGQSRRMTATTVEVGGQAKTLWSTVWGPVLIVPRAGLTWGKEHAYAIKDANTLNARSNDAWMAMDKARDVEDLRVAMGHQGIPWINTLAADRSGAVLYADLSNVPDVTADDLRRCAPSAAAAGLFASAGVVVLDGSRTACGWRQDPTAPTPGLIPPTRMPVAIRHDYVQNSNDSYWLSNPAIVWPDISPLVGSKGTAQGLRTRMGLMEIRRQLAGQNGSSATRMDPADVEAILFSDGNMAGLLVMDDVLLACKDAASDPQKAACAVLTRWDRSSGLDAVGAPLFREFWRRARVIKTAWRVPFDPSRPIDTPSGFNVQDATVQAAVLQALAAAVGAMKDVGVAPGATFRVVQVKQTSHGPVPVPGGEDQEGVLNAVQGHGLTPEGYDIDYGSSYIQLVTFDADGPVAKGMLTYGQASDPASPFAYDQLDSFSKAQWPAIPFKRQDVERHRQGEVLILKMP